ncbi:SdrD B-like domain-containing protein [Maribacter halichondriae]|uniref:SdrD B-like domain-containing protein n=1 Tax=Maribacter halichondriae TaxID=2980554 RepID=UPI0023587BBA|nr:SdrD B-like domain-containing protein [Maribacter sp. Hal144]
MAKNYARPITAKNLFTFLMLVPFFMLGNPIDGNIEETSPKEAKTSTIEESAMFGTVTLPDAPSCTTGIGTYSWVNNLQMTNTGWVNADIRFVQGGTALIYEIPGPYPSDFSQGIRVDINEVVSWDGYPNRQDTNAQQFERWKLVFLKENVIQFVSDYTQDLEDGVTSAQWKGPLNQDIVFPNGIDRICIVHYEDPTLGTGYEPSANSVVPSSICLSYEPICDLEVDAGDDVEVCTEENIELTATYDGTNDCVSGCVYPVLDMLKCTGNNPDSEEIYLVPGSASDSRRFNASVQRFETFDNGTARYTATATNGVDIIEVDMQYSGHTTVAPANSPKEHSCNLPQDTSGFEYYTTLNGTITSQNHGTFYTTSMGPSFQIGMGADVTRAGFGASGWFTISGGDGYYTTGDINLPLGECDVQGGNEVIFQWTTQDGTIVGASDQQTIEVSTSGTYQVEVTNCNGCEAMDEVVVNNLDKVTIGDFVWDDTNRNGIQDNNETGVDGLTVSLYDCNDTFVADMVTENGGFYSFDVCPGDYYIVFENVPAGYDFTSANAGNDDMMDSDAGADGKTPCFTITDTDNYSIDAGLVKQCMLEPAIQGDDVICKGEEIVISAGGGDTFLWSTGATTASILVTPEVTTTYTVTISDSTIPDCEETLSFEVEVSTIDINAGMDIAIIYGESTTLTVTGTNAGDEIYWSTGETTQSITVSPETTTTYSVMVTNELFCIAEDEVTVTVNNPCNINPSFKILPRDTPGVYIPGDETAACIGDDFYIWMYIDGNKLGDSYAEDFTDWKFIFEFPNGDVIVQENEPQYPGNNRTEKLNLTAEDFGEYIISWVSPEGCERVNRNDLKLPRCGLWCQWYKVERDEYGSFRLSFARQKRFEHYGRGKYDQQVRKYRCEGNCKPKSRTRFQQRDYLVDPL